MFLLFTSHSSRQINFQILLFEGKLLSRLVEPDSTPGTSFPDTSRSDPIALFNKESNNVAMSIEREVPPFPTLPNLVSVENDATLAKSGMITFTTYWGKRIFMKTEALMTTLSAMKHVFHFWQVNRPCVCLSKHIVFLLLGYLFDKIATKKFVNQQPRASIYNL